MGCKAGFIIKYGIKMRFNVKDFLRAGDDANRINARKIK